MKWREKKAIDPPSPAIIWATEFLRSRLLKQAQAEGTPLSGLEMEYLHNCRLEGDAWQELDREFARIEDPVDFQSRMIEILRRAYQAEISNSPEVRAEYLRAVELLEDYWPEFELWSIPVPALADRQFSSAALRYAITALFVLLILGVWWLSR